MAPDSHQCGQSLTATLLKFSKQDLVKRDVFGRTILHILLLCNRHDLLRHLLKNNDVKDVLVLTDYENGWNCLHYAIFHKRILCFKVLMEYLRRETGSYMVPNSLMYDLVRCKDRNKYTPFQLLDNDLKDLIWIPGYIDDNDRFHLTYRYVIQSEWTTNSPIIQQFRLRKSNIDFNHIWWDDARGGSDLYMLGSNKNYTLGLGDTSEVANPSKVPFEHFDFPNRGSTIRDRLHRPRFKQVGISKNYTLVLTTDMRLYSSGLGTRRGRSDHGSENHKNPYRFNPIVIDDLANGPLASLSIMGVEKFAISDNHSLILANNNCVYAFGLNTFGQLGTSSTIRSLSSSNEDYEPTPVPVAGDLRRNFEPILGLAVSEVSSVAWSENSLFFWGLNTGQMGIPHDPTKKTVKGTFSGSIQCSPNRVSLRDTIKLVQATPLCTFVVTTDNNIHVFTQYQHFKLPRLPVNITSEKHFDIFRPTKLTKQPNIIKLCAKSHRLVCLVLDNGDVMSYSIDPTNSNMLKNIKYSTLWKSYDRDMKVVDLDVSLDGSVILCTRNGSTFIKSSQNIQRRGSVNDVRLPIPVKKNKFRKVFNINRVIKVSCDNNFTSFAYMRDDIDVLPFELPKNSMLNDLQYLSPVIDTTDTRKQAELLGADHTRNSWSNHYYAHFLGVSTFINDHGGPIGDSEDDGFPDSDILQSRYYKRYYPFHTYDSRSDSIDGDFDQFRPQENLHKLLLSNLDDDEWLPQSIAKSNHSDFTIKLSKDTYQHSIPIHRHLFCLRSPVFRSLTDGDIVVEGNINGQYNEKECSLTFNSSLQLKSLLIFVHYLYTGKIVSIWDSFPNRSDCPAVVLAIKKDFFLLIGAFQMTNLNESRAIAQLRLLTESTTISDDSDLITIVLSDGSAVCHPSLLSSRSAYFETVLSDSWNGTKTLSLEGITKRHFDVILRHIYGVNDLNLFDEFESETTHLHEDFINFVMEIIEIADELLLLELKAIGQLAIKDLIDLQNALTLLKFAESSNAKKLFMACSWYIYNNLEMYLLDNSFQDLTLDVLSKLEKHILFFHHCKVADFANVKKEINPALEYNWMQESSGQFVKDFVFSMAEEHDPKFMKAGRTSFTPLVDEKYLPKVKTSDKRRLSRKSTSRKNSALLELHEEMAKLRRSSDTKLQTNESKYSESAIEEDDQDFEPVSRRRQKSLSRIKPASPSSVSPTDSPSVSAVQSLNLSSTSLSQSAVRNASANLTSPKPSTSNSQSKETKSTGPPAPTTLGFQPVLGEKWEKTQDVSTKKNASVKFKFGQRPSQKERRMQHQVGTSSNSVKSEESRSVSGPWKSEATNSATQPGKSLSLETLPILGSSSWSLTTSSPTSNGRTPSLTSIMLQESLRIEAAKANDMEKRSLQDIQQEQMFEKWWQEEAERIQRQQNPPPHNGKPRRKKNQSKK